MLALTSSDRDRVPKWVATGLLLALAIFFLVTEVALAAGNGSETAKVTWQSSWWFWPSLLFVLSLCLGTLSVVAGVGGGVLFVPIVSGFFPFHLDFVRCAGLLVALTGALSAGPGLLRCGLANLRLALPAALVASISSIFGAVVGLALPAAAVQVALGGAIICIVFLMAMGKRTAYPLVERPDALSSALGISGAYYEESVRQTVDWRVHRAPAGFALFVIVGFAAGMFGLGAGWANVPILNLLMGAPLKIAVASSVFSLSLSGTSAAWVYINQGACLPLITAPSIVGMMIGTRIGVRILTRARPRAVKWLVVSLMLVAGIRAVLAGLNIW